MMNILWESLFWAPCSIFLHSRSTDRKKKRVSPPHYFTIIDDQNRSTKPTVRSHFNSPVFSFITSGCIIHCNFSTFLHAPMLIATTWQMWASPKLAGLTLDSVWVMKAITPTVTLTCHSGIVYCRLQLCPSLAYTEVVNTISTSGEGVWARCSTTAAAAKQLCSHNESHIYICSRHQRTLFQRLSTRDMLWCVRYVLLLLLICAGDSTSFTFVWHQLN